MLPDKYKSMQTTTVDMYVLSVKPVDSDKEWCIKANTKVKGKLKSAAISGDTIIVKVRYLFFDFFFVLAEISSINIFRLNWHLELPFGLVKCIENTLIQNQEYMTLRQFYQIYC